MDIATIIGLIIVVTGVGWSMYGATGGDLSPYISVPGIVLVAGGAFGAVCLSMPLRSVLSVGGYIKTWLFSKDQPIKGVIKEMVGYAEVARRDGMLALENALKQQQDPFLKKGLQLAMDGTDPTTLQQTLEIEIAALAERHRDGKKFFDLLAKFAPGFGLASTLVGQVGMFKSLGSDASVIGQALAVALLGTLYGALMANMICGPISEKLALRSAEEQFMKEMTLVGIMSIQAGDNPHVVQMKLQAFLSEKQRQGLDSR